MKVVVLHATGNSNVRAIISSLDKLNMLAEFNTAIALNMPVVLLNLLPSIMRNGIKRRTFPVSSSKVRMHACRELVRLGCTKIGIQRLIRHESGWASVDAVYRNLDRVVGNRLSKLAGKHRVDAVYAYEDGALNSFRKAKEVGVRTFYELPIAFWETGRKLMLEEAERLPDWAKTLHGGITDSPQKLNRKSEELALADVVICPSLFVKESLPVWAGKKEIVVAPFGSPKVFDADGRARNRKKNAVNRPLRVLFCGSLGQRKGLADLFSAIGLLHTSAIELIVMGTLLAPMTFYRDQLPNFTYEQGRSHEEVLKLMRSCDVFCLPSIVEGRALVMQEAMSQGLPLIITPNTGGADLIIEGDTGFQVPIREPHAIAEKINWFLEHRSALSDMRRIAQEHAARYSWEEYGAKISETISKFCAPDY